MLILFKMLLLMFFSGKASAILGDNKRFFQILIAIFFSLDPIPVISMVERGGGDSVPDALFKAIVIFLMNPMDILPKRQAILMLVFIAGKVLFFLVLVVYLTVFDHTLPTVVQYSFMIYYRW